MVICSASLPPLVMRISPVIEVHTQIGVILADGLDQLRDTGDGA